MKKGRPLPTLLLLSTVFLLCGNCKMETESKAMNEPHMMISIVDELLHLEIQNPGPEPIRIWRLENSWGWESLEIHLRDEQGNHSTLSKKPRTWTRNGPSFHEIEPKGSATLSTNLLQEAYWELEKLNSLQKRKQATIQVVLNIRENDETKEFGIYTDTIKSQEFSFSH